MTVTFDAPSHTYWGDKGVRLPSVTQILKWGGLYNFDMVDPEVLDRAARIGTRAHGAILVDFHQGGRPLPVDDPDIGPFCQAYEWALAHLSLEVHETEVLVSGVGYAGTLDILGRLGGEWAIGDLKTTAKMNLKALKLQTAAYALAVEQERGITITKRFGLHLSRDGKFHYEPCGGLLDWSDFRGLLIKYRAFNL